MIRTIIVEDCAEDDFGQRATDEVTGEQSYIDDERSCFGHGTTMSVPGIPDNSRVAGEEKKRKWQRKR